MQKNWIRIVMVLVAGGISGQSSAAVKEKTKVSSSYDVQTDVQKKEDGLGQREVAQKQKGITQRMWTFVKTHKWKFLLGGMLARYLYLEKEKWCPELFTKRLENAPVMVDKIPEIPGVKFIGLDIVSDEEYQEYRKRYSWEEYEKCQAEYKRRQREAREESGIGWKDRGYCFWTNADGIWVNWDRPPAKPGKLDESF